MSTTIEKITFFIIGAIISGIVNFFIGRYKGRHNLRYQNFLRTSEEFRNAFLDMQIFLEESDKSTVIEKIVTRDVKVSDFIESNIRIQKRAYMQFLPYLGFIKKRRFRKAWEDYANPKDKNPLKSLSKSASLNRFVAYSTIDSFKEREIRAIIKKKINKLLKFAEVR